MPEWWENDQTVPTQQPRAQLPAGIPVRGADPRIPLDLRGKALDIQDKERKAALSPYDAQKAAADARKAVADAAAAEAKAEGSPEAKMRKQITDSLQGDRMLDVVRDAKKRLSGWSTGVPSQILGNIGGTEARGLAGQIDTLKANLTIDNLMSMKEASSTGASGLGALSEQEGKMLASTVASLDQAQSREDLEAALSQIESHYRRFLALNAGEDPRLPDVAAKYGLSTDAVPPGSPTGTDPAKAGFSQDAVRYEDDPALKGVRERYVAMLGANKSYEEIAKYLRDVGVTNPGVFESVRQQVEFRRANPNVPVDRYSTGQLDDRQIPQTGARQFMNQIGDSPVGAAVIGAGNAATGFNLPRFTDNPELTRAGIAGLESEYPKSSLAGNVAGGAMAGLAGELGLARLGVPAGVGVMATRPLAAEGLYGAGAGYGLGGEDAGIGDVLGGAAAGIGGGIAGRAAVGGIAGGVGPTGGPMRPLYDEGVRPTPGQRFGGSGMVGDIVNRAEQAYQSVPFLGSAVRGARQGARDQFERGAFRSALREIGMDLPDDLPLGTEPHRLAQEQIGNVYDQARAGMQFAPDQDFSTAFGTFQRDIQSGVLTPDDVRAVDRIIASRVGGRMQGGQLQGEQYKAAMSDLSKAIRDTSGSRPGVSSALQDFQSIMDGAARRASDPRAVELLDAADRAYAKLVRIEEAAKMAGGDPGRFTPSQFDRSVQKTSGGVRSKAYLRGDALMEDYAQAGKGLVDTLPNSGTVDRGLASAAMGGAAYINPQAAAVAAAMGIPYMPGVRNVVSGALAPTENATRNAVADFIRQRQQLGGLIGAPLAITGTQ